MTLLALFCCIFKPIKICRSGFTWAIAKGTQPIIGATKERHVIEAAEAAKIQLTSEEVARLEALADTTGIDTRGGWEHSME